MRPCSPQHMRLPPPTQVRSQLGVELTPVRDTLVDGAKALLAAGMASPAWWKGACVDAAA